MIRGLFGAMWWVSRCGLRRRRRRRRPSRWASQIRIVYGEPKNPAHRPIYERLQKRRVLEDLRDFLSPLKLPQPLTIKIEGCGVVNAYYSAAR